jgi:hypothetical protein
MYGRPMIPERRRGHLTLTACWNAIGVVTAALKTASKTYLKKLLNHAALKMHSNPFKKPHGFTGGVLKILL